MLGNFTAIRGGTFLDIGANIGTTSVYVKKKIDPSLKIVSFEPNRRNFDMLKINCILNNTEDIECVHLGLGEGKSTEKFYYCSESPGSSSIVREGQLGYSYFEDVHIDSLDNWICSSGIAPEDIGYLWIDVEGFESKVIKGAEKTLKSKKIPMIQEFNPSEYNNMNEYIDILSSVYEYFIIVDENGVIEGNDNGYPLSKLREYAQSMIDNRISYSDLFFY